MEGENTFPQNISAGPALGVGEGPVCAYPFCYRWRNNEVWARFYGRRCRVLARCRFNTVVLMFEDGEKLITSGNALRRWEGERDNILSATTATNK